jgi:hypothetical protein
VINAYPYTADNPGEVDVYVEGDPDLYTDGIPDSSLLTSVFDAIQLDDVSGKATRRPAGAAVNVFAITRQAVDVYVAGLDVPDPTVTKAAITAALDEWLRSREPFISGLTALPRKDRITQAQVAGIVDDIVSAAGGTVTTVGLDPDDIGLAITLQPGQKAKLNVEPTYS